MPTPARGQGGWCGAEGEVDTVDTVQREMCQPGLLAPYPLIFKINLPEGRLRVRT